MSKRKKKEKRQPVPMNLSELIEALIAFRDSKGEDADKIIPLFDGGFETFYSIKTFQLRRVTSMDGDEFFDADSVDIDDSDPVLDAIIIANDDGTGSA
jgi:hypothetical protein